MSQPQHIEQPSEYSGSTETRQRLTPWRIVLILAAGGLITCLFFILLCYGSSVAFKFAFDASQTATSAQFATNAAQAAGLELPPEDWMLAASDDFNSTTSSWDQGTDTSSYGTVTRTVEDGVYKWLIQYDESIFWPVCFGSVGAVTDFFVSVEVQRTAGEHVRFGLMFRTNGGEHYVMELSGSLFKVPRKTAGGNWVYPLGWQDAPMLVDQPNKLSVLGKGSHFWFFVNDQYVGELEDDTIASGTVGISISTTSYPTSSTRQQTQLAFDNFELYVPALPTQGTPTPNQAACTSGPGN